MRGKLTIVAIIAVGLLAAAVAWWYGHSRGQRVLRRFGGRNAQLIRTGTRVELARLAPAGSSPAASEAAQVSIEGKRWRIEDQIDISHARGLVHFRQALIEDASYRWSGPPGGRDRRAEQDRQADQWQYLLTIQQGPRRCQLAFDLLDERVVLIGTGAQANIGPIAEGLRAFFAEQYTQPQARSD